MRMTLASIAHAFNYRVAVLRGGAKPAVRIGHSRKAERQFLEDVSIPWDQQVTHHLVACAWPGHTYFLTTAAAASK